VWAPPEVDGSGGLSGDPGGLGAGSAAPSRGPRATIFIFLYLSLPLKMWGSNNLVHPLGLVPPVIALSKLRSLFLLVPIHERSDTCIFTTTSFKGEGDTCIFTRKCDTGREGEA
jgi:hypothetical protein